ncbi:MAG: acyl-CoA dehydrogenase family protein [Actinomycetota bacterium]|nr:acyl-CoA dehydrogenase family protein [Actinomycetota bacterium]
MIDFELSPKMRATQKMLRIFAENAMRPVARQYDEQEHEKPLELIKMVHGFMKGGIGGPAPAGDKKEEGDKKKKKSEVNFATAVTVEEIFWGDAGVALAFPGEGLGGAAIHATGTPEQKERFLSRFKGDEPVWGAMAITEPEAGSDSANIKTTAVRDGDEWILNGEKIFVTSGKSALEDSKGLVVVWATVDPKAGRAGIKPFVVEHGTPGMQITKVEDKLGIRCSDTVSISFMDCRIPADNILGSPEITDLSKKTTSGFKGVMKTFDATRPMVSAMAIGVGRAALDFLKETLAKEGLEVRYEISPNRMTSIERDIAELEANLKAARLLTWRAVWMLDNGERNSLEASMAKAKAGLVVTQVTQKCVELLGPLGYSRKLLLEKWMRDAKINDIFEGTGQIQMLITARNVLGFGRDKLK